MEEKGSEVFVGLDGQPLCELAIGDELIEQLPGAVEVTGGEALMTYGLADGMQLLVEDLADEGSVDDAAVVESSAVV